MELPLGQVLYCAGDVSHSVYFPNDCLVSFIATADRERGLEVGLVGREGLIGVPLALGVRTSPVKALVQGAGSAMCITAAGFGRELKRNPELQRAVERCAYVAMATAMQVAVCNNVHVLEARLARWLLMTRDRVGSDEFQFTQQFLALMLGVRRAGVTTSASALQRRKLIRYSRGTMRILDPGGLRAAACSCYEAIRRIEAA